MNSLLVLDIFFEVISFLLSIFKAFASFRLTKYVIHDNMNYCFSFVVSVISCKTRRDSTFESQVFTKEI